MIGLIRPICHETEAGNLAFKNNKWYWEAHYIIFKQEERICRGREELIFDSVRTVYGSLMLQELLRYDMIITTAVSVIIVSPRVCVCVCMWQTKWDCLRLLSFVRHNIAKGRNLKFSEIWGEIPKPNRNSGCVQPPKTNLQRFYRVSSFCECRPSASCCHRRPGRQIHRDHRRHRLIHKCLASHIRQLALTDSASFFSSSYHRLSHVRWHCNDI